MGFFLLKIEKPSIIGYFHVWFWRFPETPFVWDLLTKNHKPIIFGYFHVCWFWRFLENPFEWDFPQKKTRTLGYPPGHPTAGLHAEAPQGLARGLAIAQRQHMGQGHLEVQRQGLEDLTRKSWQLKRGLIGDFMVPSTNRGTSCWLVI